MNSNDLLTLAQRMREYNHNPHHINPVSESFHTLVKDSADALSAVAEELTALKAGQELDELRRACAEILGQDPEAWPSHGNASLAIASALALAVSTAPSAPATVQGDADKYRWLREQHNNVNSDIGVYDGANILATPEGDLDLDAALAALAAARQESNDANA